MGSHAGLIELEAVRRGNAEAALALAERGRARVLLESMEAGQAAPGMSAPGLSATRLSAAWTGARPLAPEGTTAVVYVALDRQLLIWVVSPRDVYMTTVDVPRMALQRLVAAFRERLNDGDEARDLAGRLYTLTWAPIAAHLQGRSSIAIVPDGPLAALPFAALDDNKTYLIKRHALSFAPSLATLRVASERIAAAAASGAAATSRRALIAANPAIDRTRYPSLPVLQAAREEADRIAALYERPTVLRGQEVTRARLIAELSRADLLHFAGHAISNDVRPDQAHLIVSAAEGGPSAARLDVADIAALRLDGVRLVVLSACQTGTGRSARGEGTLSLARPFLVAGVPTVVATLWLVDDRTARDMMLELHRRLRAGDAPDVALQRVQLARLREARLSAGSRSSSTVPATLAWADFVVVGAARKSQR